MPEAAAVFDLDKIRQEQEDALTAAKSTDDIIAKLKAQQHELSKQIDSSINKPVAN